MRMAKTPMVSNIRSLKGTPITTDAIPATVTAIAAHMSGLFTGVAACIGAGSVPARP